MKLTLMGSGSGTNIENLIRYFQDMHGIVINQIITDNPNAYLLERVKPYNIPTSIISYQDSKKEHEQALLNQISITKDSWIILAGYMRLLSSDFIKKFYDTDLGHARILNIHPSLLPAYPGLNSYQRAFEDPNTNQSGITVHIVDAGMDTGPVILQKSFSKMSGDTLESFTKKGLAIEYQLYPKAIKLMQQKVRNNEPIPA